MVSSLINLQKYKAKDEYHKELFEEIKSKVDAISSIHEMVYQTESYISIEFNDYINHLIDELTSFFKNKINEVEIIRNFEKVTIDIDKAIPLALIINEVITNSFKHAFDVVDFPKIEVSLKTIKEQNELIIHDNGKGFDFASVSGDSLGIDIISGLLNQLDGKMIYENNNGTTFKLVF